MKYAPVNKPAGLYMQKLPTFSFESLHNSVWGIKFLLILYHDLAWRIKTL